MSTIIYKGGGGVQKVQNLVYVENGCPLNKNWSQTLGVIITQVLHNFTRGIHSAVSTSLRDATFIRDALD